MLYVKRLEAFALQAFFRGVSAFLIPKGADLHAVVFVFLRSLDVHRVMFLLQAAGDGQRVILPQQRSHLNHIGTARNQRE